MVYVKGRVDLGYSCWLDLDLGLLVKDDLRIALSGVEFRLLRCLTEHIGAIVTGNDLIDAAWGRNSGVDRHELHVYVQRLRKRLEDDPKRPACILTAHRLGYMFQPRQAMPKGRQIQPNIN